MMRAKKLKADRSLRAKLRSPGRPPVLHRAEVVRGYRLTADDLVRRAVIMALMCKGWAEYESVGLAHPVTFGDYFATELQELKAFEDAGLVEFEPHGFRVTSRGWYLVRAIAMVFDRLCAATRFESGSRRSSDAPGHA